MPEVIESYYFRFTATGVDIIDDILESVAMAGSRYHHTNYWMDSPSPDEQSEAAKIQAAAEFAADKIRAVGQGVVLRILACCDCPFVQERRVGELICGHGECQQPRGEQVIGWQVDSPAIPQWCPFRATVERRA